MLGDIADNAATHNLTTDRCPAGTRNQMSATFCRLSHQLLNILNCLRISHSKRNLPVNGSIRSIRNPMQPICKNLHLKLFLYSKPLELSFICLL